MVVVHRRVHLGHLLVVLILQALTGLLREVEMGAAVAVAAGVEVVAAVAAVVRGKIFLYLDVLLDSD